MEYITNSPSETEAVGAALAKVLKPGAIIAYRGDLGAGKTAFTRGLARGLGASDRVTSPTYTIVNEYLGGKMPLFHFDMYRLGSSDELFDIGWEDYLARDGVFDELDAAITNHPNDTNKIPNRSWLANYQILYKFDGKASHAGGSPFNGINALYAANCGMQAANCVRETFPDADHIRFHPIITQGGAAVNAIPDRVVTESYLRASSMEAIARENLKVNRAFAGAAAAMGCQLQLGHILLFPKVRNKCADSHLIHDISPPYLFLVL